MFVILQVTSINGVKIDQRRNQNQVGTRAFLGRVVGGPPWNYGDVDAEADAAAYADAVAAAEADAAAYGPEAFAYADSYPGGAPESHVHIHNYSPGGSARLLPLEIYN
jgi:hypothetical protein